MLLLFMPGSSDDDSDQDDDSTSSSISGAEDNKQQQQQEQPPQQEYPVQTRMGAHVNGHTYQSPAISRSRSKRGGGNHGSGFGAAAAAGAVASATPGTAAAAVAAAMARAAAAEGDPEQAGGSGGFGGAKGRRQKQRSLAKGAQHGKLLPGEKEKLRKERRAALRAAREAGHGFDVLRVVEQLWEVVERGQDMAALDPCRKHGEVRDGHGGWGSRWSIPFIKRGWSHKPKFPRLSAWDQVQGGATRVLANAS